MDFLIMIVAIIVMIGSYYLYFFRIRIEEALTWPTIVFRILLGGISLGIGFACTLLIISGFKNISSAVAFGTLVGILGALFQLLFWLKNELYYKKLSLWVQRRIGSYQNYRKNRQKNDV